MKQEIATTSPQQLEATQSKDLEDFVTFYIKGQMFGIPVLKVQDILTLDKIAPIPLAPPEVEGSINLRGRIVTVIDMRERLGLGQRDPDDQPIGVTVEQSHEFYTLLVDKVGDVVSLSADLYEDNPSILDTLWRKFALGGYRMDGSQMVVLDLDHILEISLS